MITFPPEFVVTKFPGYFWNTDTKTLFTIKVTGELRPMAFTHPSYWTYGRQGYRVSYRGKKRWLTLEYLMSLQPQTITVAK